MVKVPYSIKFYLNKSRNKGGRFKIFARIHCSRKKAEFYTQHSVEETDWLEEKERTKKNLQINAHLSAIETEVHEIVRKLREEKKIVTAATIKNILTHKESATTHILQYYDSCIERLDAANEVEKVTVAMYGYSKERLAAFIKEKKNAKDYPIENIDYKFIQDFDLFLLNQKANKVSEAKLKRNTASKHHSRIRTILIRARKEGIINRNPYEEFKLKKTPSNRTYLSTEELNALKEHDLNHNPTLIKIRDIFIFSVYTGLRFVDAQMLTMDRIIKSNEGKHMLNIVQEKTGEALTIPFLLPAVKIMEKYNDSPERKMFNRVIPSMSNQKLNSYLKVIASLVGITKTLSHHVARHTCATTVLLNNEVPMEVVSKWLGHTSIKTTQIYGKITNNYMQKIADKLEGKI